MGLVIIYFTIKDTETKITYIFFRRKCGAKLMIINIFLRMIIYSMWSKYLTVILKFKSFLMMFLVLNVRER